MADFIDTIYRVIDEAKLRSSFLAVGGDAANLEDKLGNLNGVLEGLGVTATVAGLNILSSHLIDIGSEAGNASTKLDAILATRNDSGARGQLDDLSAQMAKLTGWDDDLFTEAQTRLESFGVKGSEIVQIMGGITGQANTMGDGMQGVLANAEQVGKALSSINAGALTRGGTTLDPKDVEAIKELKKAGQFDEARALLFQKILESYAQYATKAGAGIRDATREIGNFNTAVGNAEETVGQGAEEMRARWMSSITPMIESLNKNHEGLLKNTGGMIELATQAGNVGGAIYGVFMAYKQLQAMTNIARIAQQRETAAEAAKIPVAQAEAAAHLEAAAAAETHAAANAAASAAGGSGFLAPSAFGLTGGAALAVGAAAVGTTIYAGIKGVEWWNDAKTMSDQDMAKQGPVEDLIQNWGKRLSHTWLAQKLGGDGDARGAEADRQLAELNKNRAQRKAAPNSALGGWSPNDLAAAQGRLNDFAAHRPEETARMNKDAEEADAYRRQVLSGQNGGASRAKGQASRRGHRLQIHFDPVDLADPGAANDDDLVSSAYG